MKKAPSRETTQQTRDDLLPEYDFDYRDAKPNRFVTRPEDRGRTIVLEPDIAEVFKSSGSVNAVLRALIEAMPTSAH
ncbi:MAG: hypothetical protein GY719_13025 [bacterium]|nr:hypothetical protein [bacterium]